MVSFLPHWKVQRKQLISISYNVPYEKIFFAELKLKLKKPKTKRQVLLLQHANRKGFNALSTFHELYTD